MEILPGSQTEKRKTVTMPQEKKFYSEEQMIEFAKSCVKEFQLEANKTNPNNGDIVRATVDLPIPALTIPEAEVDAREILKKHIANVGCFTDEDFDERHEDGTMDSTYDAMHEYSDLRLAKAMELYRVKAKSKYKKGDAVDFFIWMHFTKCISAKIDGTFNEYGDERKPGKSLEEWYKDFLADKKKGEGK